MLSRKSAAVLTVAVGLGTSVGAQSDDLAQKASFVFNGTQKNIQQANTPNASEVAAYLKPQEDCAPLCLTPVAYSDVVPTLGEVEVIDFLTSAVSSGKGLLIDSRMPEDRAHGFIAGSVSVPHVLVSPDNPYLPDIMQALGARSFEGMLNFSDALPLVIFDDGPSTMDAPQLISALLDAGYPSDKISYYRGGMLVWTALGLNTEDTNS